MTLRADALRAADALRGVVGDATAEAAAWNDEGHAGAADALGQVITTLTAIADGLDRHADEHALVVAFAFLDAGRLTVHRFAVARVDGLPPWIGEPPC
jgi:hypothetical protein